MKSNMQKTTRCRAKKVLVKPPPLDPVVQEHLMTRLRTDADRVACRFNLKYKAIAPESSRVRKRYGSCFTDGLIKIRLAHARTGKPLKYSSLVDTLCHELAHLKHFNHGRQFKLFHQEIMDWARSEKIYCPGPPTRDPSAEQPAPEREKTLERPAIFPPEKRSLKLSDLIRLGKAVFQLPLQIGLELTEKRQGNEQKSRLQSLDDEHNKQDKQITLI